MNNVAAVILAGGEARRMGGGDKCLLRIGKQTVLECILARIRPQVRMTVLNANGDPARFGEFDIPVVPDLVAESLGPLLGILSGLSWVKNNHSEVDWIVTLPGDTPFPPKNLVDHFLDVASESPAEVVCAVYNGRTYPPCALWSTRLVNDLRQAVIDDRTYKIDAWTEGRRTEWAEFNAGEVDPFFNINSPDDLIRAETLARYIVD